MKIGPVDGGSQSEEVRRQREPVSVRNEAEKRTDPKDEVVISQTARQRAENAARQENVDPALARIREAAGEVEAPEGGTDRLNVEMDLGEVREDRVERARQRIEDKYYDQPEVREKIARRITDDFLG